MFISVKLTLISTKSKPGENWSSKCTHAGVMQVARVIQGRGRTKTKAKYKNEKKKKVDLEFN